MTADPTEHAAGRAQPTTESRHPAHVGGSENSPGDRARRNYPEMLPLHDAAEALECEIERVVELLKDGTLPGLKVGRGWVIPRKVFFERVSELALSRAEERRAAAAPDKPTPMPARRPGRPRLR